MKNYNYDLVMKTLASIRRQRKLNAFGAKYDSPEETRYILLFPNDYKPSIPLDGRDLCWLVRNSLDILAEC